MRKKIILPALMALMAILVVTVVLARNTTQVSAQQILDKAAAAQSTASPTQGIRHLRYESFDNTKAPQGDLKGFKALYDGYLDLATGKFRSVYTDADTGQAFIVSASDGYYTFSSRERTGIPLLVYRVPQPSVATVDEETVTNGNANWVFDKFHNNPTVELQGKQSYPGGRTAYVLRCQGWVNVQEHGEEINGKRGSITMVLDARTYEFLESQSTIQKDGKELLIRSTRVLTNEILPANASIHWDLSDLQGVTIVDDSTNNLSK